MKLNEIKIILIGDANTGKTSLLKRLKEDTFQTDEAPTDGINIVDIDFGVCDTFKEQKSIHGITGHFWDFGGQEMMQATHQFFLTKRSIYILVLHANYDANNAAQIRSWVKQIRGIGGNSPIIVVANQLDTNPNFDFVNKRELRDEFPQIKCFLKISCKENTNLDLFKNELAEIIPTVELLNTEIPESWMTVKNRLKAETGQKYFLNEARFLEICNDAGLTDREGQKNVIRFLHDIGLALHFDAINLSDYYVLNPYWITYGAYQILTSTYAGNMKGIVEMDQLDYIVNEEKDKNGSYQPADYKKIKYSPSDRRFLIDMLHEFKLCFRTPDGNRFIVPDLLDPTEPETITNPIRNLERSIQFVYEYDYLPKSTMPCIMVETHPMTVNRWRTGCVLRKNGCEALVTYYQNRIFIIVTGEYKKKREFMAVIRNIIDSINDKLGSKPIALIPLPGTTGGFALYERLLKREKDGKAYYIHDEDMPTEKQFLISELLEGIAGKDEVRNSRIQFYEQLSNLTDILIKRITGTIPHTYKKVDIELNGKNLIVTGANGSGKTSFAKALYEAISFDNNMSSTENELFPEIPQSATLKNLCLDKRAIIKFHDEKRLSEIKQPIIGQPIEITDKIGSQLEKYLLELDYRQSKTEDKKIQTWFYDFTNNLRILFEDDSLILKINLEVESPHFQFIQKDKPPFTFQTLSAGYRAIFDIYADLLMHTEYYKIMPYELTGIVFIDEIDSHLHVSLQRLILPFFTQSFPKIQFIVTTHSPFVLMSTPNTVVYDLAKNEQITEDLSYYTYSAVMEGLWEVKPIAVRVENKIKEIEKIVNSEEKDIQYLRVLVDEMRGREGGLDSESKAIYLLGKQTLLKEEQKNV